MIAVGDELLDGRVADTNSARVAQRLRPWGLRLHHTQAVPDDLLAITAAVADSLRAFPPDTDGLLVLSGGLGVTADDLTRAALSDLLRQPLTEDPDGLAALTERLHLRGRALTPDLRGHALRLSGSRPLANPTGLAIGFCAHHPNHPRVAIVTLPGVPSELEAMLDAHLPAFVQRDGPRWRQRRFGFVGLPERDLERRLPTLPPAVRVSLNAKSGVVEVSLSAHTPEDPTAPDPLADAEAALRACAAAPYLITTDGEWPHEACARLLIARGQTLATAESCTGGLLAHALTDIAGVSACYLEGFVTYANQAKVARLQVSPEALATFGAVSRHTVQAMAIGARRAAQTDWAIATSGIAGPGGAVPGKPTGLVHVAVAGPDDLIIHRALFFPSRPRALVKQLAAHAVFALLACALEGRPPPPSDPLPNTVFVD
jgi:nicotinamide-nucleotide amidase